MNSMEKLLQLGNVFSTIIHSILQDTSIYTDNYDHPFRDLPSLTPGEVFVAHVSTPMSNIFRPRKHGHAVDYGISLPPAPAVMMSDPAESIPTARDSPWYEGG